MSDLKKSLLNRIVSDSTREMFREGLSAEDYSLWDWLHGYVYGRWPYLYIGIGVGEHPVAKRFGPWLARAQKFWGRVSRSPGRPAVGHENRSNEGRITFADTYHGKVVPLEAARQLVTINEPVRLKNLEHVIPYARARDIILHNPDHIIALECPCRSAREKPCLPLDVCLIIGEPFAGFVAEHHPRRSRWISPDEAIAILHAEDQRGHVHHAFFKDAMLGRFYAICNCCSCCCGAIQSHRNGNPMLAASGYVSILDEDLCIGCGDCEEVCQFEALKLNSDGFASVDEALCMGCGVCVNQCLQRALSLEAAPEKGVPLEIRRLMDQVH